MLIGERRPEAIVIGGGVIGLTTGILLCLHGFNTKLVASRDVGRELASSPRTNDLEASFHAIASIVPHGVKVQPPATLKTLSEISRRFFECLSRGACGIVEQRHFELFEDDFGPWEVPYQDAVRNFRQIEEADMANVPRRPGRTVRGWTFRSLFVEAPFYLSRLRELFDLAGGLFVVRSLQVESLDEVGGDVVINCTGASGWQFGRESDDSATIVRGHYAKLLVNNIPKIDFDGYREAFSYNYHPIPEDYPTASDRSADVYFYPRNDGWVFGGSRQCGPNSDDPEILKRWPSELGYEQTRSTSLTIGELEIPEPIVSVNREVLASVGLAVDGGAKWVSGLGFRSVRKQGVRLELDQLPCGRPIVHNYGHAGVGLSLSWGCAWHVVKILEDEVQIRTRVRQHSGAMGTKALLGLLAGEVTRLQQSMAEGTS